MNKAILIAAVLAGTAGAALAQTPGVAPMPPAAPMMPQAPHRMMAMPETRDGVVAMVRDHFARADANRDGFIAREEMQAMRGQRKAQRMAMGGAPGQRAMRGQRANPGAMFERLDTNRDNMISRQEFDSGRALSSQRRAERGAMRGQRMAMRGHGGMLRRADADRDGRVSLAEAQAAALARFDRVDANRDGRITPEERQQLRQQRMQQRRAPRAG